MTKRKQSKHAAQVRRRTPQRNAPRRSSDLVQAPALGSAFTLSATLFSKGNHEDFVWLDAQHDPEVLPGLLYPWNGRTMDLGEGDQVVRVGGVAGCPRPANHPQCSEREELAIGSLATT